MVSRHRQDPVGVISPGRSRRPDEINLGVGAGLTVAGIDRLRTDDPVPPVRMSSAGGVRPARPRTPHSLVRISRAGRGSAPPALERPSPMLGAAYRIERKTANLLI